MEGEDTRRDEETRDFLREFLNMEKEERKWWKMEWATGLW